MPYFGTRSQINLETCHIELQDLFKDVVKKFDCSVICGYRDQSSQDHAFTSGFSKLKFPQSKHNTFPSMAVDVVPYPIAWDDIKRMYMFVGVVRGIAYKRCINIRCGADWDGDLQWKDQCFHDMPHVELL